MKLKKEAKADIRYFEVMSVERTELKTELDEKEDTFFFNRIQKLNELL